MLFLSGAAGAGLLAIGSNLIIPVGTELGGFLDLAGILSMMMFFGLAEGE